MKTSPEHNIFTPSRIMNDLTLKRSKLPRHCNKGSLPLGFSKLLLVTLNAERKQLKIENNKILLKEIFLKY